MNRRQIIGSGAAIGLLLASTAPASALFGRGSGVSRIALVNNATYFVATTGNDTTGDGTSGNPWATPQHAYNWICDFLDLQGYTVTVQCAAGNYNTAGASGSILDMSNQQLVGGGFIVFQGQSDRTLVQWTVGSAGQRVVAFYGDFLINCTFQNLQLVCTGTDINGGFAGAQFDGYARVNLNNVDFVGAFDAQVLVGGSAFVLLTGNCSLSAGTFPSVQNFFRLEDNCFAELQATLHISSSLTYAEAFVSCRHLSHIVSSLFNFSHVGLSNVHGPKFYVFDGGTLDLGFTGTATNTLTGFPGDQAGILADGWIRYGTTDVDYKTNQGALFSKAGLPTTSDIVPGGTAICKNTSDSTIWLAINDGGTIKKVQLV